jgi:alkyldihydroxyacetonephosphate synthase
MDRLEALGLALLGAARTDPRNKLSWFRHNGWGYKDTEFVLRPDGAVMLTGNRYQFAGQKLPKFREWA